MELVVFNEKVHELVDQSSPLENLGSGYEMAEGPVFHNGVIYFTDWPASKIFQYQNGQMTLINDNSYNTIGMTYDRKNDRILRCARDLHSITDLNGEIIVDNFKGVRLNGTNDLVADKQGRIYFTDPLSRKIEGEQIGHSSVFRYDDKIKELTLLNSTIKYPNGLALSLDETKLYIIDTSTCSLFIMDLATKKTELFIELDRSIGEGMPDGLRLDEKGNIYTTGPGGIWLIDSTGVALGMIRIPEKTTNLCFDDKGIFITAKSCIYRVDTKIGPAV